MTTTRYAMTQNSAVLDSPAGGELKTTGALERQTYHLHALSRNSGSLSLLEPQGPVRDRIARALPYNITVQNVLTLLQQDYICTRTEPRIKHHDWQANKDDR